MRYILMFTILFVPRLSNAESSEVSCPVGQKPVSFADGNNLTTVCVDEGAPMDETVSVGTDGAPDEGNYD